MTGIFFVLQVVIFLLLKPIIITKGVLFVK